MRRAFLSFGILCLLLSYLAVPSHAALTIADDRYLYFGRYNHCTGVYNQYEGVVEPILWQKKSATLYLSALLVDKKEWGPWDSRNDVHWAGGADGSLSTLRLWLNGEAPYASDGFSHTAFDTNEQLLLQPNVDGDTGAKVTIPEANMGRASSIYGPAGYRGASGNADYWTRTPNDFIDYVWAVDSGGDEDFHPASDDLGVRPALSLNLVSVIFKSGSNVSPSAGEAGSQNNPYWLYLSAVPSADLPPSTASVNGDKLTLAFPTPLPDYPGVFHAYQDTPSADVLKGLFSVVGTKVSGIDFSGGNIVLTLEKTYRNGESVPDVSYMGSTATDGIGFMNSGLVPTTLFQFKDRTTTNDTPAPTPDPGPTPAPSSATTPTGVSITVGDTRIDGEKQPDGKTYLITVPTGTDVSNLPVNVGLPAGATSVPKMPTSHDFTEGPLEITVTAQDGKTKVTYTIKVQVESPAAPTEKPFFTINIADCEIIITENADGTRDVKVRIPFASGSNVNLLASIRATLSSLGLSNISYSYMDAQGNETPVETLQNLKASAKAPYLQIVGTAANMDAIKDGAITSIQYTLKGDNTTYVQTFANGGLKIASMPGYPSTPTPAPSTGGSSSGCDAGFGASALLALVGGTLLRRK